MDQHHRGDHHHADAVRRVSAELAPGALWYAAYANPPGVKVKVSDPNRAKTILYSTRAKLRDPDIGHLEVRTSPTDPKGELWIVNPADPSATGAAPVEAI